MRISYSQAPILILKHMLENKVSCLRIRFFELRFCLSCFLFKGGKLMLLDEYFLKCVQFSGREMFFVKVFV